MPSAFGGTFSSLGSCVLWFVLSRLSRGGSSRSGRRLSHQSSVGSDGSFRSGPDISALPERGYVAPKATYWRLAKLNLPEWHFALLGSLGSIASGLMNPFFALIISSVLKTYYETDYRKMKTEVNKYVYIFSGLSLVAVVVYFMQHFFFGIMGENLTKRVREMMFQGMPGPLRHVNCITSCVSFVCAYAINSFLCSYFEERGQLV